MWKPTRNEDEAARLFRKLWTNRTLFGWRDKDRRRARWLVNEMRQHRMTNPEASARGKRAQRKGKRSQREYVKRWRLLGFTVRDQSDLEAAGVELGADLEVREARLSVQNKERKTGDQLMRAEGREAWKDLCRVADLRGHEPVLRWCEGQSRGRPQLDLVVIRESHYAELVQIAGYYSGALAMDDNSG